MNKKQAWDYALGLIKVDELKPIDDFMKMVDKEIRGELTVEDIEKSLNQKYKMKDSKIKDL
jgi:hypothetical protein